MLTVGGVNTYSGPTVINAGTLKIASVNGGPNPATAVLYYPMTGPLGGRSRRGADHQLGARAVLP